MPLVNAEKLLSANSSTGIILDSMAAVSYLPMIVGDYS